MATRIPLPGNMIDTLMKGVNTGSNMYSGIMHPILQREQLAQQRKNHLDNLALQQQAQARLSQLLPYQIQALKDAHIKSDPDYELNQLKNMMGFGGGNKQPSQQQSFIPGIPAFDMPENGEYPSEEQFNQMIANPSANQEVPQLNEGAVSPMEADKGGGSANGIDALQKAIMNGYLKKHFGYDAGKETPEQKRYADLQSKMEFENIKEKNKEKAIEQKELLAVKKDLPTLEKSLKGVDELMRIAKENPDMFGHAFMPDRFAKTTKIKDFGKWQNLISDAIAGLEQKLSARGNVVALKLAANLKPSHAEQQDVAIGKLESMRQQLTDSIDNSRKKLGIDPLKKQLNSQYKDDDLVIVEGPNGDETMTYAQAKALGAE